MEDPIKEKYPWISFMHCVSHIGSLVMSDIGKLDQVAKLVETVIDIQNWFGGNQKVAAILNNMCLKVYGQTRKFLWAPETCFVKILLLLKQFKRLMGALRATVEGDAYKSLHSVDTSIDDKITGEVMWDELDRVLLAAPLMCLVRLGDTAGSTLSKLRKTVLWVNEKFEAVKDITQVDGDELEGLMYNCWLDRMEEFQSPIANAAYMLDSQWVNESRNAGAVVMENFWAIAKEILCKGRHRGVQQQAWEGGERQ